MRRELTSMSAAPSPSFISLIVDPPLEILLESKRERFGWKSDRPFNGLNMNGAEKLLGISLKGAFASDWSIPLPFSPLRGRRREFALSCPWLASNDINSGKSGAEKLAVTLSEMMGVPVTTGRFGGPELLVDELVSLHVLPAYQFVFGELATREAHMKLRAPQGGKYSIQGPLKDSANRKALGLPHPVQFLARSLAFQGLSAEERRSVEDDSHRLLCYMMGLPMCLVGEDL